MIWPKHIRTDLEACHIWQNMWKLNFNVFKCKFSHIGSDNYMQKYDLNGNLTRVENETDLGVTFDENITLEVPYTLNSALLQL